MDEKTAKTIWENIRRYRLMGTLLDRLKVVVVGGVSRASVYRAFSEGGTTPLLQQILETAKEVIHQHETDVAAAQEMVTA